MNLKSFFPKNPSSQNKKQQMMIVVFVAIILITVILLYFNYWRATPPPVSTQSAVSSSNNQGVRVEKVIKDIDFDISFLKTARFQDLKTYGQWPLKVETKGRQNPFLSY